MRIGWIGLGKLGFPCAIACANAGHEIFGYGREQRPLGVLPPGELPYIEPRRPSFGPTTRSGRRFISVRASNRSCGTARSSSSPCRLHTRPNSMDPSDSTTPARTSTMLA